MNPPPPLRTARSPIGSSSCPPNDLSPPLALLVSLARSAEQQAPESLPIPSRAREPSLPLPSPPLPSSVAILVPTALRSLQPIAARPPPASLPTTRRSPLSTSLSPWPLPLPPIADTSAHPPPTVTVWIRVLGSSHNVVTELATGAVIMRRSISSSTPAPVARGLESNAVADTPYAEGSLC